MKNNESKATEIAKHILETYPVINKDNLPNALWFAAIEMAEWKEQQMMKKACEWLNDMACYYAHCEYNGDTYEKEVVYDTEKLIKDFKKAMEETTMTRKEEINEQSFVNGFNDHDKEIFTIGVEWADSRPRKGLVDVEKVEQWIKDCFAFINDAGHHNFKVDKFIENFRLAMKE